MSNPKVIILSISCKPIFRDVADAVMAQDYDNFEWLVSHTKRKTMADEVNTNWELNVVEARTGLKKIALASNAEYFVWLDTDILLKPNAISELVAQASVVSPEKVTNPLTNVEITIPERNRRKHLIGGWFHLKSEDRSKLIDQYNVGIWVADNTIYNKVSIEPSVTRADKTCFGVMIMTRQAFEDLEYPKPQEIVKGGCACLNFAAQAQNKGYELWADGNVVCEHLIGV